MSKSMYEKFKIMDDLLKTLNLNIQEEQNLLGELRSTSANFREMLRESDKRQQSRNSSTTASDNIKLISENVITVNETLVEIKDLLQNNANQQKHSSANPLSSIGNPGSGNSSKPVQNVGKYINIAKSIFTALGLAKIFSTLGKTSDKSMQATYSFQQVSGLGESAAYSYKSQINNLFKGSSYTTGTDEYARMATIASSIGMDDPDRISNKYLKSIASSVESMGLDTAQLSQLLYTMEKRGTFTNAQISNVTDSIYRYSKISGNITPQEMYDAINSSMESMLYGTNLTGDEYDREREEVDAILAGFLDQGFDSTTIETISNLIETAVQSPSSATELWNIGVSPDQIQKLVQEDKDLSSAYELIFNSIKDTVNTFDDYTASYKYRLESLGLEVGLEEKSLWSNYDSTRASSLGNLASTLGIGTEEAANDMTRSLLEEYSNKLENFFSPVVDWFAQSGVGSTEFGIAGGILGSSVLKKGWNWVKGVFSKGSSSVDDIAGAADDAVRAASSATSSATKAITYSADDLAKAFGTTVDDVISVFGESARYSSDDIAKAFGTTADDVVKALGTSADDVAKGAGLAIKGASKALAVAGVVIDAGISAYDAYQGFSSGDNREGWQEVGGGIGSIGGGLGGSAGGASLGAFIGSLVAPGPGTAIGAAIGGIIGGIGGGIGGDKLGEAAAEGIYDATATKTYLTQEQKAQVKSYYDQVSKLYEEYGNNAAQSYTLGTVVPYLNSIGISKSITDKYKHDVGKPDFMIDYEKGKLDSYAQGTAFLPTDGLIYAHAGEAIIPAQYNPVNNVSSMRNLSDSMVAKEDVNDIYDAIQEMKSVMVTFFDYIESYNNNKDTKDRLETSKNTVNSKSTKTMLQRLLES